MTTDGQELFDTAVEGLRNAASQMEALADTARQATSALRGLVRELEEEPEDEEPEELRDDYDGWDEDWDDDEDWRGDDELF